MEKKSTVDILNEYVQKLFNEDEIEGFQRSVETKDIFHYPVIIRNLPGATNPFLKEKPKCKHCFELQMVGNIKDAQVAKTELFGHYIVGYLMASRAANSYENFKEAFSVIMQLMIQDLRDALDTYGLIIGNLKGSFHELEMSAGYVLSIEANVGAAPPRFIDANTEDPERFRKYNLHKAWEKK